MRLTRRDAAAALAAIGAGGAAAAGLAGLRSDDSSNGSSANRSGADGPIDGDGGDSVDDEAVVRTQTALAAVVFPEAVDGVEPFVETFLDGRLDGGDHAAGVRAAVAELNELARTWHGDPVPELSVETRERLLREVGADTADEHPDGTTAERVRYYLVNDLLLALYASPTGGELVGIENPQGTPGGTESYRQGPR